MREPWLEMQLQLWPDAKRSEQQAAIEQYFRGTSKYVTAAFIAEVSGTPIGCLELNLRAYAEGAQFSPVPHVEAWLVVPHARRQGVGRALMQAAEDWERTHGYKELTSDTNASYPLSPAAHLDLGFEVAERLICFRKSLV